MGRITFASKRLLQVPVVVAMIVTVVAVDAGTAVGSGSVRTSDACLTFVLGRGGFGTLQHCRSFGRRDIPSGSERNGSGQFVITGLGSTATITWAPPFEGSTATVPAVVGLANVSFNGSESDPDVKGSCPAGTFEQEMTADVVSGEDTGGTFRAELCSGPANGLPFTEEPNTKARITEP